MPTRDDAALLARRLHALAGGDDVRRKAAARELARLHPTEATEMISHLLALARGGDETASRVLVCFVSALGMEASQIPHAQSLRRLAMLQDLPEVATLFAEGPAVSELDEDAAARNDAKLFTSTLGHLKTKARLTRDPDEMSRLAAMSNADVVRQLLLNPRLTEPVVVRIAARRPARPEPLLEIWKSSRWFPRHAVKRALVFNPYLPPDVGAKIVPLLSAVDLKELARTRMVHPSLREQARLLLASAPSDEGDAEPGGDDSGTPNEPLH